MRNKSALFAGVLAGIASPGSVFADSNYQRLQGSDMNRLRGDVSRVGNDFNMVISREYGKTKSNKPK